MLIDTSTRAVTLSAGRLIIHAEGKGSVSGRRLETTLRWLRALCSNNQKDERAPLRLQILDLQGNLMLASDDAGALVEVLLPAGTYQVKTQFGKVQRGYTLTLAQGASFDLYLRLAPDQH